jgi:nucleoside-diphosphate-sugar epimerase
MVNVLLVGGACEFGLVLAKKLRAVGAKVFIFDTKQADLDDVEFVLGSLDNSLLVRRVVNECQVRTDAIVLHKNKYTSGLFYYFPILK